MNALPLLLALVTSPALAQAPALVTVGPTTVAPAIDGVFDEAAWAGATEVTGFVLNTERVFAREQTRVRLCHDDRALHLGFRCAESKLRADSQQSHLFLARATGRDANVFGDDCVEVFIGPPESPAYYQFAANAAGGTYESRGTEAGWNCEWQCAAKVGEGEWTVEMAIPFAALGATAQPAGEWALNLCREEKPSREISTWSGLQGLFHSPQQFGRMRLGATPALRVLALPGRAQPLRVALEGLQIHAQASLIVRAGESEKAVTERLAPAAHAEASLALPRAGDPGQTRRVRWEIAAGGEAICGSAWVEIGGSARDLTLLLRPQGARVGVLLNGAPVAADEQGECALTLSDGANTLGLDCRGGAGAWSVEVSLVSGGEARPFAGGWRASSDPPAEWMSAQLDASGWAQAPTRGAALLPPEPRERVVFRRTLFSPTRRERFWPRQTELYLPRGSRQRIYPLLAEEGAHVLPGFTYVLDLPRPLKLEASDRSHGSPVRIAARPPVRRRGVWCNSYALTGDGPLGSGMQLLAHWRSADGALHHYAPVLDVGGTFDWQLLRNAATAPKWATECGVLLLKWQEQGITGEAWFDDVTMRAAGQERNLLPAGTFDEPQWEGKALLEPGARDGKAGRRVHIVATEANVDHQQGVWVTEPHVPVKPGQRYVFTVWARAQEVRAPGRQPRACLLVSAGSPHPSELTGYAHWEALDGNVTEVERPFPIHVLPTLPNKRPRSARFIACYYGDLLENERCNRALAQTTARSGINAIYGSDDTAVTRYWPGQRLPEFTWPINWAGFDVDPPAPDFLKRHSELTAVQKDGKPAGRAICPTAVLDEPNDFLPALRKWLTDAIRGTRYRQIDWDHEFPVWRDTSVCFCDRCLAAFRRFAKLAEAPALTRETVIAGHKDEWVRFRCDQNARMAERLGQWVKEVDPTLVYSVYSGFQTPYTHETYGVDWNLLASRIDLGIAGYNGDRQTIMRTVLALQCRPFIAGEMYHENDRTAQYALPKPATWRLRLLRAVLNDRGHGVLVWWLPVLDGGGFWGLSQVAALVHDFEPFFTRFDRRDELVSATPPLSPDSLAVLVSGEERLIICANGTTESVPVRLRNRLLRGDTVYRRWPEKRTAPAPRVLETTLGSEEIAVWWIGPAAP